MSYWYKITKGQVTKEVGGFHTLGELEKVMALLEPNTPQGAIVVLEHREIRPEFSTTPTGVENAPPAPTTQEAQKEAPKPVPNYHLGSRVKVNPGVGKLEMLGTITKLAHGNDPYYVDLDDGEIAYCTNDMIEPTDVPKPPPCYKPKAGDMVMIPHLEGKIGRVYAVYEPNDKAGVKFQDFTTGVFMSSAIQPFKCLHNHYDVKTSKCPDCGMTLDEIKQEGK